jgi:hypothetical protein
MATVNTKKAPAAINTDARKDAQWNYARKCQEALGKRDPKASMVCFVIPVFTTDGKETASVVRAIESPTLSMVMIMSVGDMEYDPTAKIFREERKNTIIFAPTAFLGTKYKPGQNIGGKIVIKYSTKGNDRDIMLGIGTNVPCVNEDGEVLYRTQNWYPSFAEMAESAKKKGKVLTQDEYLDMTADDETPVIANLEEIKIARLANPQAGINKAANDGRVR